MAGRQEAEVCRINCDTFLYKRPPFDEGGRVCYFGADAFVTCASRGNINRFISFGMIACSSMAWESRTGKARTRGWMVRERGLEEVNANRNIEGRTG